MKRIFTEAQKKVNCERAKIWYHKNTEWAKKRIYKWAIKNPDKVRASRKRNRKQILAGQRKWYQNNRKHALDEASAWAKRNPRRRREIARAWHLFVKYEFTQAEFNRLLKRQSFKCAICESSFKSRRKTFIDHCHNTSRIRGLLCPLCNTGLGMFKDSPKNLLRAVKYLKNL